MSTEKPKSQDKSIVQLLEEIKSGQTDPVLLDKPDRQRCVEAMFGEGLNCNHIAQHLKCSEKTIYRDKHEISVRNALSPSVPFAKEFIGDVLKKAMNHHDYLVRISRMKETSEAEKIQAVFAGWKILKELIEKLQSLGYLPPQPQEIVGDLYHHLSDDSEKSLEEIKKMVIEIEVVSKETGEMPPEAQEELKRLKDRIDKAEIAHQVVRLSQKQQESVQNKENENDI